MSLIVEIEEIQGSGVWVDMRARLTNIVGAPVALAVANDTGQAIAGAYTIIFHHTEGDTAPEDVEPGTSGNVFVLTSSPDNPYRNTTGRAVNLDGETVYRDLVGGLDITFSDDPGFSTNWVAEIRVGHSFGAVAAYGTTAGLATDSRRIRVRNPDPDAAQNVRAVVTRHAKLFPTAGIVFEKLLDFAASAVEKITGGQVQPYSVTVENKTGSDETTTADIKFDGALVNVVDQDGMAGTSAALTVVDTYTITDGDLEGVEFQLSQAITNGSTANILIFNSRFTQIAPDLGGAPGDWGTADVAITSDPEAEGTIAAGGFGFFHVRVLAPSGSVSGSNPYICDAQIIAETSSPAGWDA